MKFKVGDKVRVRKDLKIDGVYGIWCFNSNMSTFEGKELTVEKVYDESYRVKENTWYWTDEMLEEVKEDKMEKTFKEVIADIKDGEVWVQTKENCVTGRISCIEGEIIIDLTQARSSFGTLGTYKLQRKEYTFEEAFKAYEEGKEIQSAATGVKCQRRRLPCENEIKDYCYYNDDLKEICKLNEFTINEIRKKWYINE